MAESSLMHKIHHHSSSASSSSSSEDEKRPAAALARQAATVKAKAKEKAIHYKKEVNRLFGRQQPVHKVLGAGKAADIFLWRNKRSSAMVLGAGTMLWFFFESMEYHLITFICHLLIVSLAALFLWSNASVFIHKAPVQVPQVVIPEDFLIHIVKALRFEINRAFLLLREIGTGRDIKKFLTVVGVLWLVSLVGSCFNFLTLFYLCFLLLFTLPLVYEKNEDQIDALGEKAMIEIKKQYAVLDAKVLSQIPVAGFKKD